MPSPISLKLQNKIMFIILVLDQHIALILEWKKQFHILGSFDPYTTIRAL